MFMDEVFQVTVSGSSLKGRVCLRLVLGDPLLVVSATSGITCTLYEMQVI
jgi:hypothetical protein